MLLNTCVWMMKFINNIFSLSIRDNAFVIFVLMISGVFWLHRFIKFIYNVCCYWEIRSFYINALKMTMVRQTKLTLQMFFTWALKIYFIWIISTIARFLTISKNEPLYPLYPHLLCFFLSVRASLCYMAGGSGKDSGNPEGTPDLYP